MNTLRLFKNLPTNLRGKVRCVANSIYLNCSECSVEDVHRKVEPVKIGIRKTGKIDNFGIMKRLIEELPDEIKIVCMLPQWDVMWDDSEKIDELEAEDSDVKAVKLLHGQLRTLISKPILTPAELAKKAVIEKEINKLQERINSKREMTLEHEDAEKLFPSNEYCKARNNANIDSIFKAFGCGK